MCVNLNVCISLDRHFRHFPFIGIGLNYENISSGELQNPKLLEKGTPYESYQINLESIEPDVGECALATISK